MSKTWEIVYPNDEKIIIKNLKKFCEDRGLDTSNLQDVAYGNRKSHKGYRCTLLENHPN